MTNFQKIIDVMSPGDLASLWFQAGVEFCTSCQYFGDPKCFPYVGNERCVRAIRKDYKKVLTEPSENSKI